ncbi:MAG: di-trans,poly-cis-decaprenylcistransferase [Clostridiales bacterium]|jgi:undecaprenyl diphosphate synthase|nr:di-trans,poly-cis-decaprenylcistransferase [Clostridiales bacterium]
MESKRLRHVGVIMDGNRRWAANRNLRPFQGHEEGAKAFENVSEWCVEEKIAYLTVYAFSTENWIRTRAEINHIFDLLIRFFKKDKERCLKENIRMKIIGERTRFSDKVLTAIDDIEKSTKHNTRLNIQIALSYGGRDEIVRAARKMGEHLLSGSLRLEDITESAFENYLDTAGIPDVDLLIRTGGDENRRLSNFLPWQTAYAELFFSSLLWPAFSKDEFHRAIQYFYQVSSKHGK